MKYKSSILRAAMTFVVALLTAATVWAEDQYPPIGSIEYNYTLEAYTIGSTTNLNDLAVYVNGEGTYSDGTTTETTSHDCKDLKFQMVADFSYDSQTPNNFTPIGNEDAPFCGSFDGDGHSIDGIRLKDGENFGLFGCLADGSTVKNLYLTDIDLRGSECIGAIAAEMKGGTIEQCYVGHSVTMEGTSYVGGIVGVINSGSITDCVCEAHIAGSNGADCIGGIVGIANTLNEGDNVEISNNIFAGSITMDLKENIGAIVGNTTKLLDETGTITLSNNVYYPQDDISIKGVGVEGTVEGKDVEGEASPSALEYVIDLTSETSQVVDAGFFTALDRDLYGVYFNYDDWQADLNLDGKVDLQIGPAENADQITVYVTSNIDKTYDYRFNDLELQFSKGYKSLVIKVSGIDKAIDVKPILGIYDTYLYGEYEGSNGYTDNAEILEYNNHDKNNVMLKNRTLYRDGRWQTICLPFNVDLTNNKSPLYGVSAYEVASATIGDDNKLNLTFSPETSTLAAGKPYFIKWETPAEPLTDPVFDDVKIDNTTTDFDNHEEGAAHVRFVGTYIPKGIGNGNTVNSCRAFFVVGDVLETQGFVATDDITITSNEQNISATDVAITQGQYVPLIIDLSQYDNYVTDQVEAVKAWYNTNSTYINKIDIDEGIIYMDLDLDGTSDISITPEDGTSAFNFHKEEKAFTSNLQFDFNQELTERSEYSGLTLKYGNEYPTEDKTSDFAIVEDRDCNSAILSTVEKDGMLLYIHDVTLKGHTLYRDGTWQTICLPFDVNLINSESPLYGVTAYEMTSATIDKDGAIALTLGDAPITDLLYANQLYFIHWQGNFDEELTDPVFKGVNLKAPDPASYTNEGSAVPISLKGTYDKVDFGDKYIGACSGYFVIGMEGIFGDFAITSDIPIKNGDQDISTSSDIKVVAWDNTYIIDLTTEDGVEMSKKESEMLLLLCCYNSAYFTNMSEVFASSSQSGSLFLDLNLDGTPDVTIEGKQISQGFSFKPLEGAKQITNNIRFDMAPFIAMTFKFSEKYETETVPNLYAIADDDEYSEILLEMAASAGMSLNIKLKDRTLYRDGRWQTICLPFDVDLTDGNSPLYGAEVCILKSASISENTIMLYQNNKVYETPTLTAYTPYLIRWDEKQNLANIIDPLFKNVTLSGTYPDMPSLGEDDYPVSFRGTLSKENILDKYVKSCRGYFVIGENDGTKTLIVNDNIGVTLDGNPIKVEDLVIAQWTAPDDKIGAITFYKNGDKAPTAIIDGNYTGENAWQVTEDREVSEVTLAREFRSGVYSTIMLPFTTEVNNDHGTFYTFNGVTYDEKESKWIASVSEVSALFAHTPYIFKPNSNIDALVWNVDKIKAKGSNNGDNNGETSVTDPTYGEWIFKAVYEPITWETKQDNIYGFAGSEGEVKDENNNVIGEIFIGDFVRAGANSSIKPFRCYLEYSGDGGTENFNNLSKTALVLPDRIEVRVVSGVIDPDDPQDDPSGDIETPTSEIQPAATANVWSYDKTIYIAAVPNTPYTIVDVNGRPLRTGITATDRDEIHLPGKADGIVIVITGGKSFKIRY
ncbi:MAG: hypothetical protein IKP73_21210 [Bacteroidales bacterium]|nr:hypothetical protein [Bacteroidales bacterium]